MGPPMVVNHIPRRAAGWSVTALFTKVRRKKARAGLAYSVVRGAVVDGSLRAVHRQHRHGRPPDRAGDTTDASTRKIRRHRRGRPDPTGAGRGPSRISEGPRRCWRSTPPRMLASGLLLQYQARQGCRSIISKSATPIVDAVTALGRRQEKPPKRPCGARALLTVDRRPAHLQAAAPAGPPHRPRRIERSLLSPDAVAACPYAAPQSRGPTWPKDSRNNSAPLTRLAPASGERLHPSAPRTKRLSCARRFPPRGIIPPFRWTPMLRISRDPSQSTRRISRSPSFRALRPGRGRTSNKLSTAAQACGSTPAGFCFPADAAAPGWCGPRRPGA